MSDLIGSVFERNPLAGSPSSPGAHQNPPSKQKNDLGVSETGFPTAQHRSQSAFARRKKPGEFGAPSSRLSAPPAVVTATSSSSLPLKSTPLHVSKPAPRPQGGNDFEAEMRRQIDEENTKRVEAMTEEEREEARREIIDRFGEGIGDLLKKMRQARERQAAASQPQVTVPEAEQTPAETSEKVGKSEPSSSSHTQASAVEPSKPTVVHPEAVVPAVPRPTTNVHSATRPSSRADRRLRFAEVNPNDIHVYESAPPSPRRKALALPPPPDDDSDPTIISIGRAPSSVIPSPTQQDDPDDAQEEGTLEDIRRRFFPNAPTDNPSVEWLKPLTPSSSSSADDDKSLRFDLSGNVIPLSQSSMLPTHLGLHHHAEGVHAGYTLEDIFLLSRSTVPAQRATMFAVLGQIASKVGTGEEAIDVGGMEQERQLRKRMIAAAVEAMAERGSLGPRAIDLLWFCTVKWTVSTQPQDLFDNSTPNAIPVDHILSQISEALAHGTLSSSTSLRLLDILNFLLAEGPKDTCKTLVSTPKLLRHIIQTYLTGASSESEDDIPHQPEALELLIVLAQSTRSNAEKLAESAADAVLRFVTSPTTEEAIANIQRSQDMSPSTHCRIQLLVGALRLYKAFAVYGLYSHVATTASSHFILMTRLASALPASLAADLKEAWMQLVEIWTVCATDPHQTRPTHDILWTQVTAWDWGIEALEVASDSLSAGVTQHQDQAMLWKVCAASWHAAAAWLESARSNGVRGGEKEREQAIAVTRSALEHGAGHLKASIAYLQNALGPQDKETSAVDLQSSVDFLSASIRLWLACLSSPDQPPPSPPFELPFSEISGVCAHLVKTSNNFFLSFPATTTRSITTLLFGYTRLSKRLPGASLDLWIAQSLSVLIRLVSGDEAYASTLVEGLCTALSLDLLQTKGVIHPKMEVSKSTMDVVAPFLLRPQTTLAPLHSTPQTLQRAATQTPAYVTHTQYGLPLQNDWPFRPLDHLLRSGTSPVFHSLPNSWDFSEVDIVRMSLVFARVVRDVLPTFGLTAAAMTREQLIFGCMKVFMLEQDQDAPKQKAVTEEVFRDDVVTALMDALLSPCRYQALTSTVKLPATSGTLEQSALPFLGTATPFYQFYTDFVGLYDSISFSHPIFTQLLIPPTSMRYPVDYRKYLWGEYSHLIPNVRLSTQKILADDLSQFLYPIERDPEMIGAYIKSLKGNQTQDFMRLIAIHHIAAHAWGGDFVSEEHRSDSSNAQGVLKAVLTLDSDVVLRDIINYSQTYPEGLLRLEPGCYDSPTTEMMSKRVEQIRAVGGEVFVGRLGLVNA